MDIKQLYREETELDVYTVALWEQRVEHFSDNYVKWLEAKINYTQCCETLKIKELMTFKDYRKNLFIKADGVYQPKNTELFVWYSKKQLKKMYLNKPL